MAQNSQIHPTEQILMPIFTADEKGYFTMKLSYFRVKNGIYAARW